MTGKLPIDVKIEWPSDTPIEQQCERFRLNLARFACGAAGDDPKTMIELYRVGVDREQLTPEDREAYDSELALFEKRLKAEQNEHVNH